MQVVQYHASSREFGYLTVRSAVATSKECLAEDDGAQARTLATFLVDQHEHVHQSASAAHGRGQASDHIGRLRASGAGAYTDNLSYERPGIVTALMREVSERLAWQATTVYGGNRSHACWSDWTSECYEINTVPETW